MIQDNSNMRFILSHVIDQILNDGDQVRIFFTHETYSANFKMGIDNENSKRINVIFSEVGTEKPVNFSLYSWDALYMIFNMIDSLMFGNGEISIQRNGCKVLTMSLAE